MNKRKLSRTERSILKKVKAQHKREAQLDPSWFEAKRVDLGSELVTAVAKRLPRWGAFKFDYTKLGV